MSHNPTQDAARRILPAERHGGGIAEGDAAALGRIGDQPAIGVRHLMVVEHHRKVTRP